MHGEALVFHALSSLTVTAVVDGVALQAADSVSAPAGPGQLNGSSTVPGPGLLNGSSMPAGCGGSLNSSGTFSIVPQYDPCTRWLDTQRLGHLNFWSCSDIHIIGGLACHGTPEPRVTSQAQHIPQTPGLKPHAPDPRPHVPNPASQTPDPQTCVPNPRPHIPDPKSHVPDPRPHILDP